MTFYQADPDTTRAVSDSHLVQTSKHQDFSSHRPSGRTKELLSCLLIHQTSFIKCSMHEIYR